VTAEQRPRADLVLTDGKIATLAHARGGARLRLARGRLISHSKSTTRAVSRSATLADVAVLDRDVLTVPEDEIVDTRAAFVLVGGRIHPDFETGGSR